MVARALLAGRRLYLPLTMLAVPSFYLFELLSPGSWVAGAVWGLQLAVLSTYCAILISILARTETPSFRQPRMLLNWLGATLLYAAASAGVVYTIQALITHNWILGILLAPIVSLAGMASYVLLLPTPALTVTQDCSPVESVAKSFHIMTRCWRLPFAILALTFLPLVVTLPVRYVVSQPYVLPWAAASGLFVSIASATAYLPLLCLVGIVSQPDHTGASSNIQGSALPRPLRTATAVVVPGTLSAAANLLLLILTPMSVLLAGAPSGMGAVFVSMYLPVSPVMLLIFAVLGVWCGWVASRVSGKVWPAALTGLVYGLMVIHVRFGVAPFQQTGLAILYAAGLTAHSLVAILGAALSRRRQPRSD